MRVALISLAFAVACSESTSSPPPSGPIPFYATNSASATITAYTLADSGNAAPLSALGGTNTTLDEPEGIVLHPTGVLITTSANPGRILVFAAGASGDVAPITSIVGANT